MKSCRASGSSIAIGSSSTRSCGRRARASVKASWACWPPDIFPAFCRKRDAELAEAILGVTLVEAAVEVARHMEQVGSREVLVERRVLGHERDPVERGQRTGGAPAEHRHLTGRRCCKPNREVQQGRLPGAVRPDERDHVPIGDRQACSRAVLWSSRRTCRGRGSR